MDEKKSISDEEAKALLTLSDLRRNTIKKIRGREYERYTAWIPAIIITFLPFLLKCDPTETYYVLMIALAVGLGRQQNWNEKRFDALVDFMEKEGLFRK